MWRMPLISSFAVALLAGAVSSVAAAADNNADKIYAYPPYGQQHRAGNDYSPAGEAGSSPPPATPKHEQGGHDQGSGAYDAREDVYHSDTRAAPYAYGNGGDSRDDAPPPRESEGPPPSRVGALPLVEATASAPDRSIPYDVRKHDARRAAIESWRSKVADRFGPAFSRWRMAGHRKVDCRTDRGGDAICTVSGVPARGYGRVGRSYDDDRY
jgi:hypothetical protein